MEQGIDIVVKRGIIPGLQTERQRRQELTRNNNKLLDVLHRTNTLKVFDTLKTRSSKSQAVLLAAKYGGKHFDKVIRTVKNELTGPKPVKKRNESCVQEPLQTES